MSSVGQLKESVGQVADQASTLREALRWFDERNKQSRDAASAALDGTGSGADAAVKKALDDASNRIAEAVAKLTEAEQRARDYAQSL